jgi:hypothetical protein
MASDTQPSAIQIALGGWRDAWRGIPRMMSVAGPAFLLTLMLQAAYQLSRGHSEAIDLAVLFPMHSIAQGLVLTPLAIAVHRYVLLDEVAPRYALDLADARFQRFFGLAIAIMALWWLSIGIWLILGHFVFGAPMFPGGPVTPQAIDNLGRILLVDFVAPLVTAFVLVRVILSIAIIFPAVAIDAPGFGWRQARDDSEGHIGRIFCAFALGFVPVLPLDAIDELIRAPQEFGLSVGPHPAFEAIGVVAQAAKSVLIVAAFAAIASRLYVIFGARLNGDAPVA